MSCPLSYNYGVCVDLSLAPPLTVENIVKEVEGVRNISELYWWVSGGYTAVSTPNIKNVMEWFLQGPGHYQPSWRVVIFAPALMEGSDLCS